MCQFCFVPGLREFHGKIIDFKFGRQAYKSVDWMAGIFSISNFSSYSFRKQPISFLKDVAASWRAMLGRLASTSWQLKHREHDLLRLLNCSPYGAKVIPQSWFCEQSSICPWCWARSRLALAKKVFSLLTEFKKQRGALYKEVKNALRKRVPTYNDVQLVYGVKKSKARYFDPKKGAFDIDTFFQQASSGRRSTIQAMGAIGARHLCTAEPAMLMSTKTDKLYPFWKLKSRFLMLRADDGPTGFDLFHTVHAPEREDVAEGIGRTFRYPIGYVKTQPHMVAELFNVKRAYRTEESYGVLRG